MGVPIIRAQISEKPVRMFFDTGAQLSYLSAEMTTDLEPSGTATDFYPGIGEFQTDVYEISMGLAFETLHLKVGVLHQPLQHLLEMASAGGILGTAILQTHELTYTPRRSVMTIRRLADE